MHSASFCKRMVPYTKSRRLFFEIAVSSTLLMNKVKCTAVRLAFFKLGSIPTWLGWVHNGNRDKAIKQRLLCIAMSLHVCCYFKPDYVSLLYAFAAGFLVFIG